MRSQQVPHPFSVANQFRVNKYVTKVRLPRSSWVLRLYIDIRRVNRHAQVHTVPNGGVNATSQHMVTTHACLSWKLGLETWVFKGVHSTDCVHVPDVQVHPCKRNAPPQPLRGKGKKSSVTTRTHSFLSTTRLQGISLLSFELAFFNLSDDWCSYEVVGKQEDKIIVQVPIEKLRSKQMLSSNHGTSVLEHASTFKTELGCHLGPRHQLDL